MQFVLDPSDPQCVSDLCAYLGTSYKVYVLLSPQDRAIVRMFLNRLYCDE